MPVDMRPSMKVLLVSAVALLGACRTIATEVSSSPTPGVRVGGRARAWELQREGEPLGLVILFQERGSSRDSLYVVRNLWHQDLGLIDGLGRAFRYLPHLDEPAWVGSGTVLAGAQRILEADGACELVELEDAEALESSPTPASQRVEGPKIDAEQPGSATPGAPPPDEGLPQSR
jgi:hypothetical protein